VTKGVLHKNAAARRKSRLTRQLNALAARLTPRSHAQIAVETSGDLAGIGAWFFDPAGKRVVVRFHFWGHVERPLARALPTMSRPLFAASHRWAMERGFTSLLLEVWRRRTTNQEARAWLPRPPGPTFPHNLRRWWAGAP